MVDGQSSRDKNCRDQEEDTHIGYVQLELSRHFSTFIYRVLSAQTNQPNFIFITRYRIALETSSCLSEEILIAKCVLEKLLLNKVESEIRPIRRKKRKMKLLSRQIAINWDFNYRMNDLKIRFEFENIR